MALLQRIKQSIVRWYIKRFVRIDPVSTKCPACGNFGTDIVFSVIFKRVIHTCKQCKARFTEQCVANPDLWSIRPVDEYNQEDPMTKIFADQAVRETSGEPEPIADR
jgi:hypothetical protein